MQVNDELPDKMIYIWLQPFVCMLTNAIYLIANPKQGYWLPESKQWKTATCRYNRCDNCSLSNAFCKEIVRNTRALLSGYRVWPVEAKNGPILTLLLNFLLCNTIQSTQLCSESLMFGDILTLVHIHAHVCCINSRNGLNMLIKYLICNRSQRAFWSWPQTLVKHMY